MSRGFQKLMRRRERPFCTCLQYVRQSAKQSGQYYEVFEKKSILATPEVRPRKWREAEVTAGYFSIRRWVPRDQQHLTAELHGGLTDPAEIAAAAKLAVRSGPKSSSRLKTRTRASIASAAASGTLGVMPTRSQQATSNTRAITGRTSPGEIPGAVPGTAAQGIVQGAPAGAPVVGAAGSLAGVMAVDGKLVGDRGGQGRDATSSAGKRPSSALSSGSGPDPLPQMRRTSDERAARPQEMGTTQSPPGAAQDVARGEAPSLEGAQPTIGHGLPGRIQQDALRSPTAGVVGGLD